MNSADGTIHFNLSFSQNSIYLHVRLRECFVNPQLLKQLAVYKIKERKLRKLNKKNEQPAASDDTIVQSTLES
ncbi:MAG: hypothetical protein SOT46_09050 [Treponema sp.]|nr:hypothetical protein [Treponema sp.]